jgi:hypothetical protein
MKRAALIALVLLGAGCKQQDAAIMLNMTGPYLVPQNANKLHIDVLDNPQGNLVLAKDWCVEPTPTCDLLPTMSQGLNATVTIVESGAAHPHVTINVTLLLNATTVGVGTVHADFQDGTTIQLSIPISPPL